MSTTDPLARLRPSEWDFRFRSGRLCLDFIATVGDREHMPFDRWRVTRDLGRWCAEAGLVPEAEAVGDDQIAAARRLREALFRLVTAARAGTRPDAGDLALLNAAARTPALAPQLTAIGQPQAWMSEAPYEAVLATIARDAIDLLSGPALARVRKCADGHCSILFLDTSRPGKRRWCSMNGCGNKVKKAAYRRRQRG
ncbi:MAG: ABATE domain-containing protein [Parvibaculaceae bacterium]